MAGFVFLKLMRAQHGEEIYIFKKPNRLHYWERLVILYSRNFQKNLRIKKLP